MKSRTNNCKRLILFFIALSAYMNNYLCFYWDTYYGGKYRIIVVMMRHLGWVLMLGYALLFGKKTRIIQYNIIILVEMIITSICACYLGSKTKTLFNLGYFIAIIVFLSSCFITDEDKAKLFDYLLKIFVILTLPGMIYYILTVLVGINVPYTILESDQIGKSINGVYYELRPMGLIIKNRWVYRLPRYTGVFDEPGVVGTCSGLFFSTMIKSKRYKILKYLVLLEGLLSFSFAFYLFLMIILIVWLYQQKNVKTCVGLLFLLVSMIVFMNSNFKNEQLNEIQDRFDFQSGHIFVDNRTSSGFDERFDRFNEDSIHSILFGYGFQYVESDETMSASYSYKMLIVNQGYLGTILYIGFFVLVIIWQYGINMRNIYFFVVFIASIYQRPYVMNQQFLLIFLSAIAFIGNIENLNNSTIVVNRSIRKND